MNGRKSKTSWPNLRLIVNPSDGLSLKRILNVPPRGIGEKTIEKLEAFSKRKENLHYTKG